MAEIDELLGRVLRVTWTGSFAAAEIVGSIGLLLAAFPDRWLGMSLDPSNTAALDAGRSYFRLVAPFYAFFGWGLALYFASQGAGRVMWPVVSSLIPRLRAASASPSQDRLNSIVTAGHVIDGCSAQKNQRAGLAHVRPLYASTGT